MICSFNKQIFPKDNQESPNGFYIMSYICNEHSKDCELAVDEDGADLYQQVFFAKGFFLPRTKACQYDLHGHWEKNQVREGKTFIIESFEQNIKKDKDAICAFLTDCFKGSGVGPTAIGRMYDAFGDDLLEVIEKTPERLYKVKGIKKEKLEKIVARYNASRGARDVLLTLTPLGVSNKLSQKIYEVFKDEAIDIINNHPYRLCEFKGISFHLADTIAEKNNLPPASLERLDAAILEILFQAEYGGEQFKVTTGHLCVEYTELLTKARNLVGNQITFDKLEEAYKDLRTKQKIVIMQDIYDPKKPCYVYRKKVADVENELAMAIVDISLTSSPDNIDYDEEIRLMEMKENVSLAPEQKNAVKLGLKNPFAVITGGPGTGKTTIIKFIRNIYMKNHKNNKILMCSPTGVAATRMSESTNGEACTVHKALNLVANEEGYYDDVDALDYDLIIVDETSMLDVYLAKVLCKSIKKGAKLLFIGDVEQLPSVGPGAVLRDIIESNVVPVAVLTKVYRQADGSLIALNALLIKNGKSSFDYGEAFQFIPASNFKEAANIMEDLYMKEIAINGINQVMMLSPFRQKTETGVVALNKIRDTVNPPSPKKKEITVFGKTFREGDKVIQLKNIDDIANGDVGMITRIFQKTNDDGKIKTLISIDFGHNRVVQYTEEDMEMIDWSYATTVHKSQGSEANTVIFNLLDAHGIMLKRNLLYTAVTRAKKKVYIVGSMSAIETAVKAGMSKEERRSTLLSQKIRFYYNQKKQAA